MPQIVELPSETVLEVEQDVVDYLHHAGVVNYHEGAQHPWVFDNDDRNIVDAEIIIDRAKTADLLKEAAEIAVPNWEDDYAEAAVNSSRTDYSILDYATDLLRAALPDSEALRFLVTEELNRIEDAEEADDGFLDDDSDPFSDTPELDLLEALLENTERFKSQMTSGELAEWQRIAAATADLRDGE